MTPTLAIASLAKGMIPFLRDPPADHGCKCASDHREPCGAPPTDLAAHAQAGAEAARACAIMHRSRVIVPEGRDDVVIGRRAAAFFAAESTRLRGAAAAFVGVAYDDEPSCSGIDAHARGTSPREPGDASR